MFLKSQVFFKSKSEIKYQIFNDSAMPNFNTDLWQTYIVTTDILFNIFLTLLLFRVRDLIWHCV